MTSAGMQQSTSAAGARPVQRVLLAAGLLSSVLYVLLDLIAAARYPGYSVAHQAISELSAIGAPAESLELWQALMPTYGILFVAFAVGVLRGARGNRQLRTSAWIMLAFVAWNALWPFFPMHQRGTVTTGTDLGHLVLGAGANALIVAFIGFGAFAFGRGFRRWSVATLVVFGVTAALTWSYVPAVGAGAPTPWLGLIERTMIYSCLLWIAVLAMTMRAETRS